MVIGKVMSAFPPFVIKDQELRTAFHMIFKGLVLQHGLLWIILHMAKPSLPGS